MSYLEIPDAALSAYEEAGSYRHALKIADPLIRAAELRHQATRLRVFEAIGEKAPNQLAVRTLRTIAESLEARAEELDPQ